MYPSFPSPQQEAQILCAIRKAGEIMTTALEVQDAVSAKPGTRNYVTAYDVKVQKYLFSTLAEIAPEAAFLGEEEEVHVLPEDKPCFVIDPIDGTLNFIRDLHCSCVSVGIVLDGKAVWGAVYNPYTKELFRARKGGGAYLNDKPIHVSGLPLEDALLSVGSSPYIREKNWEKTFSIAASLFLKCADFRRSGSAAYDLCSLACGRTDLFFELILGPWDYCAGAIIIEEAGGFIHQPDGSPLRYDTGCPVFASNTASHDEALRLLRENI